MAVKTRQKSSHRSSKRHTTAKARARRAARQEIVLRYFPVWIMLAVVAGIILPSLVSAAAGTAARSIRTVDVIALLSDAASVTGGVLESGANIVGSAAGDAIGYIYHGSRRLFFSGGGSELAPLFTAPVAYWSGDIARWADQHDLDPNLLATLMQIESCGHPTVSSSAGAQGLFQVMPFHFASDEDQLDPNTNARRGANFLNECLRRSGGDIGLALACYNGGPSVIGRDFSAWPAETQRFYRWGTGIYADAQRGDAHSPTLDRWLSAGGANLCARAGATIGINWSD